MKPKRIVRKFVKAVQKALKNYHPPRPRRMYFHDQFLQHDEVASCKYFGCVPVPMIRGLSGVILADESYPDESFPSARVMQQPRRSITR